MRIFFAGSEFYVEEARRLGGDAPVEHLSRMLANHRRCLFSYLYLREKRESAKAIVELAARYCKPEDMILDSGAFSLMFGASQGSLPAELGAYDELVCEYIEDLTSWGWPGIVVEMDVDRVLGVGPLEQLRERFAPLGDRVMYAWHLPQGPAAVGELARRFSYVSFSMIEVARLAPKRADAPIMARDLLSRIEAATPGAPPRVHLLGCNRAELLMDRRVWSADASTLLAGVRLGNPVVFDPHTGKSRSVARSSDRWKAEERMHADTEIGRDYWTTISASAEQIAQMERHITSRVSPVPMRGAGLEGGPYRG